jgi:hypothetical protein
MPHRFQILVSGEKVVSNVLPAMWKWKESILKLNTINSAFGLKYSSISNLSKIRKLNFHEYDLKKHENNLARCSAYDRLHSLQRTVILGSQAAMLWDTSEILFCQPLPFAILPR